MWKNGTKLQKCEESRLSEILKKKKKKRKLIYLCFSRGRDADIFGAMMSHCGRDMHLRERDGALP